jgi:hypothetical protein
MQRTILALHSRMCCLSPNSGTNEGDSSLLPLGLLTVCYVLDHDADLMTTDTNKDGNYGHCKCAVRPGERMFD